MSAASSGRFYLTTPIYYVSDVPHIGHAYTTIVGDAFTRYERIRRGRESVFYLTGTDEHGEKLERAAAGNAMTPQTFVDLIAEEYKRTWQRSSTSRNDDFIRTTEPRHEEGSSKQLWRTMRRPRRHLHRSPYEGLYCVGCENVPARKRSAAGEPVPRSQAPRRESAVKRATFSGSLSMSSRCSTYTARCPDFIEPAKRMNEVRTFVQSGLKDLSVSRSSFKWGVPVPGDAPGHVIYVWMDALTNYFSALQKPAARQAFWGTAESAPGDSLWSAKRSRAFMRCTGQRC
jgi:methionyl-tRNA synthetase